MSTINNVVSIPRNDLHAEVSDVAEDVGQALAGLPADDLTPGYLLSAPTQLDLREALPLLERARAILRRAAEREDSLYNEYCDRVEERSGL
jgi:hypothetical protein